MKLDHGLSTKSVWYCRLLLRRFLAERPYLYKYSRWIIHHELSFLQNSCAMLCRLLRTRYFLNVLRKWRGSSCYCRWGALSRYDKDNCMAQFWFQQDDASSHTARSAIDFFNQLIPHHLMSINSDIDWPPRSPDLTPPDLFLWVNLK